VANIIRQALGHGRGTGAGGASMRAAALPAARARFLAVAGARWQRRSSGGGRSREMANNAGLAMSKPRYLPSFIEHNGIQYPILASVTSPLAAMSSTTFWTLVSCFLSKWHATTWREDYLPGPRRRRSLCCRTGRGCFGRGVRCIATRTPAAVRAAGSGHPLGTFCGVSWEGFSDDKTAEVELKSV
jgi:hypothetical protein